jgi:hypothetical protein
VLAAADWVLLVVAAFGILGTLLATVIVQWGEARRTRRAQEIEDGRRAEDRRDALQRERREAVRSDYREALRFVARTRRFVTEMRKRLDELAYWSAHKDNDDREVEDLDARAVMLRDSFRTDLREVQATVGAWGSDDLVGVFDAMDEYDTKAPTAISMAIHFKIDDVRLPKATQDALAVLDDLLGLLDQARQLLYAEQLPEIQDRTPDGAAARTEVDEAGPTTRDRRTDP